MRIWIGSAFTILWAPLVWAQAPAPAASPAASPVPSPTPCPTPYPAPVHRTAEKAIGDKKVTIDYFAPQLCGRDVLTMLPVGGVWRMGGTRRTTLVVDNATLEFDDTHKLKAGSYYLTLFRAPDSGPNAGDKKMELFVVDEKTYDEIQVPMAYSILPAEQSDFVIEIANNANPLTLRAKWGKSAVAVTFSLK